MIDVEKMLLADEIPEADAIEQRLTVDIDDETGLDSAHLETVSERDANQADLVDQATIVDVPGSIWQPNVAPPHQRRLEQGYRQALAASDVDESIQQTRQRR
jgi:hypothetical protein